MRLEKCNMLTDVKKNKTNWRQMYDRQHHCWRLRKSDIANFLFESFSAVKKQKKKSFFIIFIK